MRTGEVDYRVDQRKLNPRYLAFAFRSEDFQAQLANISAQSTRPYVAISIQRHLTVPWHSINVQSRIVAILGSYDDLIEVNRNAVLSYVRVKSWAVRL